MTDTPRPWDRLTPESDPAYEACAAYLDTGSLRDAYRQRSGNEKATPSHRRDSQSASRHAAIREQRQRLREHLIQPGVLERHQVGARHLRLAPKFLPLRCHVVPGRAFRVEAPRGMTAYAAYSRCSGGSAARRARVTWYAPRATTGRRGWCADWTRSGIRNQTARLSASRRRAWAGTRRARAIRACKRRGGDGCMTPSEQNAAARAWADTDPAGAQQAICSAGSLRALRRAYVALRREQPDAGRRRVREVIRVIRFAIRALARGSEFQPAGGELRIIELGWRGTSTLIVGGVAEHLAGVPVDAAGLSALALLHALLPRKANRRRDPILPRITIDAQNLARKRGELIVAPEGRAGLRAARMPLFPST